MKTLIFNPTVIIIKIKLVDSHWRHYRLSVDRLIFCVENKIYSKK